MKVLFDDGSAKSLVFDVSGYLMFLRDLGLTERDCRDLTVKFAWTVPGHEGDAGVYFSGEKEQVICLLMSHCHRMVDLNQTLLHETRHFQMHRQRGACYLDEEWEMAYDDRPSEQDALLFEFRYANQMFFSGKVARPWLRICWLNVLSVCSRVVYGLREVLPVLFLDGDEGLDGDGGQRA